MIHWDDLTQPQRNALRSPCLLAEETVRPRFASGSPLATMVFTVNTGYE